MSETDQSIKIGTTRNFIIQHNFKISILFVIHKKFYNSTT